MNQPPKLKLNALSMSLAEAMKKSKAPTAAPGEVVLNWNVSPADYDLAFRIAQRVADMSRQFQLTEIDINVIDIAMRLTACHANGCPLKLWQLLASDNDDFTHDVFGICRFLDAKTGKLTQGFTPRFRAELN